jgi:hypothetical protein
VLRCRSTSDNGSSCARRSSTKADRRRAGRCGERPASRSCATRSPVVRELATEVVGILGGADSIEGYGKGVIVGEDGELEHGALWHAPGGYGAREVLGEALAIVPSSKKVGGPGTRLDVPIGHRTAAYVRSHLDAMEVSVPGAPRPDELVLVLVMTDGPRVHARMGGLRTDQITKRDGLR